MLFRFAANLELSAILDWQFVWAYLAGTIAVYLLATIVAMVRGLRVREAAIEAQCAVIGNVGFLGIPMLVLLLGANAIGPVMMVLAVDLIVFSSLVVILITGSRDGRMSLGILRTVGLGLLANPMVVSISAGLVLSSLALPIPVPVNEFLEILGGAATPGALFAIGASLAGKSAERVAVAGWLSLCKLLLHPAAVAVAALLVFDVDPYAAGVMITAAALPVAGNVYILAQHYGVAPARVSAAILLSTGISILTISAVITWVTSL
jgi:predicted permease